MHGSKCASLQRCCADLPVPRNKACRMVRLLEVGLPLPRLPVSAVGPSMPPAGVRANVNPL